ncbi:hypothetical protein, partial [Rothia sp. 88186D007BW]
IFLPRVGPLSSWWVWGACLLLNKPPLVVNFSVGLMAYHTPLKGVVDVIRACSAHENFHYHVGDYLRPKKKLPARGIRVLNSAEDSHEAYDEACSYVIGEAFERWREWHPKK